MNLSSVEQTAIVTLVCRALETRKKNPLISDPMAVVCLERLMSSVPAEARKRILKLEKIYSSIGAVDAKTNAQRAGDFDRIANDYISNNPSCTVINLGCGFDTRFWRIDNTKCRYVEIDLPEVIALKSELLKDRLSYELISCSVLDKSWVDRVTLDGNCGFLLIAEGLFAYLPGQDAVKLLNVISQRFNHSQLALDVVPEKYTKGLWKVILGWKLKQFMGVDASFIFGLKKPHEIESYGNGLKVIDEVKRGAGWVITVSINIT